MNNVVAITLCLFCFTVCAQNNNAGDNKFLHDFRGTASITHNGVSLVPSFSLGDPALLFDLKFRKDKLSFEPDMRFSLDAKPWTMLFWFRYKAIEKNKFSLRIGAHPAVNFRTVSVIRNGTTEELLESRRYLGGEIVPRYQITNKIGVGMYYLYGRGFDAGVKQTNFLVLNTSFNQIQISEQLVINFTPQVYYLTSDKLTGYYTSAFLTLAKKNCPFSLTGVVNKGLRTQILPDDDFTWSVLLNYSFSSNKRSIHKQTKV
ncbi:hypothetical protein SAMN04488009_1895 [Maribacter sedimenticola]|uniref:DUF481 domain-containing protein n=1 Tax=Maribacter sedimenticola TaxID=228956 RepID=A0ABY1SGJ9_9FLAO|nr:hypothetical protein [Maribacter sedimenticola]SNR45890.1 hypothetical protein SAMN04488009_1895 [Maribacter sedimenticola]